MRGYWGGPPTAPGAAGIVFDRPATDAVLAADGWLTTGDFGFTDPAGCLHLVGRANELYIRGGYNVYPAEVEGVLGGHQAVAQVAVVGAPDPVLGEIGVAFVVPIPEAPSAPDELLAALRELARSSLADYKAPDRLVLVDSLPLTSMMKVDKRSLAERAELAARRPDRRPADPPELSTTTIPERSACLMTGRSIPAQGGVTDDPIRIGTMLYTLVEPHRGHQVEYNRWYERDHFYAGCQIGAYNFAGARFVATAPLKALRFPEAGSAGGSLVADPEAGSYLGIYFVLDGHHDEWNRWAVDQVNVLHASGRMYERAGARPHRPLPVRVGAPEGRGRRAGRTDPRPPVPRHGLGVRGARRGRQPRSGRPLVPGPVPAGGGAGDRVASVLGFSPLPLLADAPGDVPRSEQVAERLLLLFFVEDDPTGSWPAVFAGQEQAVADSGLGRVLWASPFIGTVPGTDTYTDLLWSTPAP